MDVYTWIPHTVYKFVFRGDVTNFAGLVKLSATIKGLYYDTHSLRAIDYNILLKLAEINDSGHWYIVGIDNIPLWSIWDFITAGLIMVINDGWWSNTSTFGDQVFGSGSGSIASRQLWESGLSIDKIVSENMSFSFCSCQITLWNAILIVRF